MRYLVLGLAAAGLVTMGALGQVWAPKMAGYMSQENLVLIVISALELSQSQMESLLSLVEELMPLRDEIAKMPEKLHEVLVKFAGTVEELRQLLRAHQAQLQEKLQTLEKKFVAGLKKILTVAQWERLQRGFGVTEQARVRERMPLRKRWAPQPEEERPLLGFGLELWRGMSLVRILPILQEVLAAKLEVLGN